jgi:hypothetical protein
MSDLAATVSAGEPALAWYRAPESTAWPHVWTPVVISSGLVCRLAVVGEGLPLSGCKGELAGPLPVPKAQP